MKKKGLIKAENYNSEVELIEPGLIRFHRSHNWGTNSVQIDAFNRYWSFAYIDCNKFQIATERDGRRISLTGIQGIYIPPYSIIKWHINTPNIQWIGYFSDLSIQGLDIPEAVAFPWPDCELPRNFSEIIDILGGATPLIPIGMRTNDHLARKLKLLIDENYNKSMSLQNMSDILATPREILIRRFKQSYGLSPVQYRLKVRLSEAVVDLMTQSLNISQVAHKTGFNDVSFFNKVFKREMNTTPSSFQLKSSHEL